MLLATDKISWNGALPLVCFALALFAIPMAAQEDHREHGQSAQPAPKHGPPPTRNGHPAETPRNYSDHEGHPNAPHVDRTPKGEVWVGHDTGRDDARFIWTTRGNTGTSAAASARDTSGAWRAAVQAVSGSTASTSASPRRRLRFATAGIG